jgi:hypothetical protein
MLSGYRPCTLLSRQLLAPENVLGSHLAFFSSYRTDQGHGRDDIYMFKPKATLNYSYEKSPESLRFGVSMPCAAIRTAKNAASPATCAKQFAPPSASYRSGASGRRFAPHHTLRYRYDQVHLLRLVRRSLSGGRRPRPVRSCFTTRRNCWPTVTGGNLF